MPSGLALIPQSYYYEFQQRGVNVKDFGATGNGSTDDTVAIQNALNTGLDVIIPAGTYMINGTRVTNTNPGNAMIAGLFPKSNQKVYCSKGATLKLIATSITTTYSIFGVYNVSNVNIVGATLIGDSATHSGTKGQASYGVYVQSSSKIKLIDCTAWDFCGDGFEVDCTDPTNASTMSDDVELIDCYTTSNYRNGLSVTGANNVKVIRGAYSSNSGTAPQAGIDFEPNNVATKNTNCKVIGAKFTGNAAYGIMATQNGQIDVEDCYFDTNATSSFYLTANNILRVRNCTFNNEQVLHLAANTTDYKFVEFEDNEIILGTSKPLMDETAGPGYLGEINWIKNRITYSGASGQTITLYGNSSTNYVSKFKHNRVIVPSGFSAASFISGNILVYSDDNVQVAENEFVNLSATSLELYYGGTKAVFGRPNRYIGPVVDNNGQVNGDWQNYNVAPGSVAANSTATWGNVPLASVQVGDSVEIIPLFNTQGLIFTYDITTAGQINIHVFNPTASAITVNNNVNLNVMHGMSA